MDLINSNNILSDNKIDIVIGDIHGDFTAILNVLNHYFNINITFQYYNDIILKTINNHLTLNTSLLKVKDFINSNELFNFDILNNLDNLNNYRIIILGDIFDTNNYFGKRCVCKLLFQRTVFQYITFFNSYDGICRAII